MLQQKTTVIDLNWLLSCGDILLSSVRRSTANEYRTNRVFANPRFYSKASIQNLCQSLQRQLSNQIFLMFRPVSDDGFCAIKLSRKSKRYRNLFKSFASKTISLRLSWKRFPQQFSQRQREKRLANISRLCTDTDQKSKTTLRQRRLWHYIRKYRLCFGRNRNRLMPVAVSMGSASQTQKCSKAPYADGPQRLDTHVCTHYKRLCARDDGFSRSAFGTLGHIRHGQRLHGLCSITHFFKEHLFLRYQGKREYSLLSQVLSSDRQEHRFKKRPDNNVDRSKNLEALPDTTETNHFSGRRSKPNFCFPDQQFSTGCIDGLSALQIALADRTFFQMDQTAPANKIVFRNFCQRSQDPGMDRDQCLCACGDNQKGAETGAFAARNTPNYKHLTFREKHAKTSTYGKLLQFKRATKL
jgi:hypothetical protein